MTNVSPARVLPRQPRFDLVRDLPQILPPLPHASRSRSRGSSRRKKKSSNFSSTPGMGGGQAVGMGGVMQSQDAAVQMAQMQAAIAGGMPPGAMAGLGMMGGMPGMAMAAGMAGMGSMGGAPMASTGGMPPMIDSTTKTSRELFVGNTPPNTQEAVLMEFLNAAMAQVHPDRSFPTFHRLPHGAPATPF